MIPNPHDALVKVVFGKPEHEVPLVDAAGEPIKDKATGKPIVKTLTECDKLEGSYQETCKELFINVSSCHISPPDIGLPACIKDTVATWAEANL